MANLSASSYKIIADYLGNIQAYGEDIRDHVGTARDYLDNNRVSDSDFQKIRLSNILQNLYKDLDNQHTEITTEMKTFVVNLQNYIIASYGDINQFLRDNDTKVNANFASLSDTIDFSIDSDNIEPECEDIS